MTDFETFVRSHGIIPKGPIVPDGRVHRCGLEQKPRSDAGRWWLALDGTVGWIQVMSLHDEPVYWRPDREQAPDTFDPVKLRKSRELAARRQEERRRERRNAILAAREYWQQCRYVRGGHPYLKAHGLGMEGVAGFRLDRKGWLVVPGERRGKLMTLQRIAPDGQKRFWTDAPAKAISYMIDRRGAAVTILCEGVATGLALFAAVPLARVLVAFTAGNLTEPDVLRRVPKGVAVVASDNDHRTVCPMHREKGLDMALDPRDGLPEGCRCNPGIIAALKASQALGCGIAVPEAINGTDWADLRLERFKARWEKKEEFDTANTVMKAVDAEIRMAVMRSAKLMRKAT